MTKKQVEEALYLEAHIKPVKRALRVVAPEWVDVDVHRSSKELGEHGKTTVRYRHALDAVAHGAAVNALTKQANIEEDELLREDDDDEENA